MQKASGTAAAVMFTTFLGVRIAQDLQMATAGLHLSVRSFSHYI